jgi:hypothetical protein
MFGTQSERRIVATIEGNEFGARPSRIFPVPIKTAVGSGGRAAFCLWNVRSPIGIEGEATTEATTTVFKGASHGRCFLSNVRPPDQSEKIPPDRRRVCRSRPRHLEPVPARILSARCRGVPRASGRSATGLGSTGINSFRALTDCFTGRIGHAFGHSICLRRWLVCRVRQSGMGAFHRSSLASLEQPAQLDLSAFKRLAARRRQILAGAIDVEYQHRKRRAVRVGLASRAPLG